MAESLYLWQKAFEKIFYSGEILNKKSGFNFKIRFQIYLLWVAIFRFLSKPKRLNPQLRHHRV